MTAHVTRAPERSLFRSIGAAVTRFGNVLAESSGAMRCSREAERLFELSDDELAKLGLTRDRIIQHAFRRYLYV